MSGKERPRNAVIAVGQRLATANSPSVVTVATKDVHQCDALSTFTVVQAKTWSAPMNVHARASRSKYSRLAFCASRALDEIESVAMRHRLVE
jgi:hypothetical protein